MKSVHCSSSDDTETTPMITPSEIIEYLYCPRFVYFLNILKIPQYEDRRFKVQEGRRIHQNRLKHNREYVRKKIGAVAKATDVYLASAKVRVRGRVDEILQLDDGSLAPLDYKFTKPQEKIHHTHCIQLILYGLLIREAYQAQVTRGFAVYVRDGNQVHEVQFTDALVTEANEVVAEIFSILETELLPRRTRHRSRCRDCCYKNICV